MSILAIAFGFLVGVSLGLLGGGGSTLAVPILVYVAGYDPKQAIAMSLAIVGTTALLGTLTHASHGRVSWRVAGFFAPLAMVGTFGGARLSVYFSGTAQLTLFAIVMLVGAGLMFRGRLSDSLPEEDLRPSLSVAWSAAIAAQGLVVGVLTGLVGVGGGFMIVPALVLLAGLSMKDAVGTSLLIIALKSAAGFVGYLSLVEVDWIFLALFTAVAAMGILVGTRLVRHFSQSGLRRSFAVFLVVMAVLILYQNRDVFFFSGV
ncbi:MAG: sulfite exporter TauE/SafE family protein [Gemmatimonadota bacterium]